MTDPEAVAEPDTFNEDFIAAHLVGEKMSVAEVKRAINAIADEIYRPAWR